MANIITRVKNILLTPKTEWPVIANEASTVKDVYLFYVAPLLLLGVVAGFIGSAIVGTNLGSFGTVRVGVVSGIVGALLRFVLGLTNVFIVAWIVNVLAPTFGGQSDSLRSLKVTAYAFTPALVAAVLNVFPMLGIVALLVGLYGLYLLYLGLPVLMRCPQEKAIGYTIVTVLAAIVLGAIIAFLTSCIAGLGMLGSGALSSMSTSPSRSSSDQGADAAAAMLSKMMGGKSDADRERMKDALSTLQKMGEQSEKAEKAARAAGQDPSAASANAVDMAKAMGAVGTMMAGGKNVTPVDYHALKELLPESLSGMQRKEATGPSGEAMGMRGSSANARYSDGANASIDIEIADLGSLSGLAGLAAGFDPNMEKETDTGYERTRKVDGGLVHQKYDRRDKSGDFGMLVGNRFTVTAHGYGVTEDQLLAALKAIDLMKLDQLAVAASK